MSVMAMWTISCLMRDIKSLQRQQMEITKQLSDYQKYSTAIGSNPFLTMSNIAGLSSELIPRASLFACYANQASSMSAMQNLQMMKMQGLVPMTGNPMYQYQMEMSAFMRFKQESAKALAQQEIQVMHEKESELELQAKSIEQQLKNKEARLQALEQLQDKEAEKVPKLA